MSLTNKLSALYRTLSYERFNNRNTFSGAPYYPLESRYLSSWHEMIYIFRRLTRDRIRMSYHVKYLSIDLIIQKAVCVKLILVIWGISRSFLHFSVIHNAIGFWATETRIVNANVGNWWFIFLVLEKWLWQKHSVAGQPNPYLLNTTGLGYNLLY